MVKQYIQERHFEPINILIVFLIGLASILFLTGMLNTFDLSLQMQKIITIIVSIIYLVVTIFFLWPKKTMTPIEIEPQILERETIKEKPVIEYKEIEKPKEEKKQKDISKEETEKEKTTEKPKIALVEVEKKKEKKPKYVGSTYNERYHLRSCRFAGVIKKKYLIEENDKKFFRLRGYAPCKICKPDKN